MDGRRVQILGELNQFSVYKPNEGVNGNEYHTVVGWTRQQEWSPTCSNETPPWSGCNYIEVKLGGMDVRKVQNLG